MIAHSGVSGLHAETQRRRRGQPDVEGSAEEETQIGWTINQQFSSTDEHQSSAPAMSGNLRRFAVTAAPSR